MLLLCLQDEKASETKREIQTVIDDCMKRDGQVLNKRKFKKVLSASEQKYRQEFREFMWSLKPDYVITLNFNFGIGATEEGREMYRNQRPRQDWMNNFDAFMNSRLVKRRLKRLVGIMRVSWVPFAESTKSGNLHYHILVSLPDRHRFSSNSLTKRKLHSKVRRVIKEILEGFFPKASVKVQAIWSKLGVDYATKFVRRSSDIDWAYWHKQRPAHDAVRLNTSAEFPTGNNDADANNSIRRLRHIVETSVDTSNPAID